MFSIGASYFFFTEGYYKASLFQKKQDQISRAMCELQHLPTELLCCWYLAHCFAVHCGNLQSLKHHLKEYFRATSFGCQFKVSFFSVLNVVFFLLWKVTLEIASLVPHPSFISAFSQNCSVPKPKAFLGFF